MNTLKRLFYILLPYFVLSSCAMSYTKAMQLGGTTTSEINETIHVEVINELIIMPVDINGHTYRFLFDTGAPFSVSQELHNLYAYDLINKSTLTDSDKSKSSLEIIKVDSINIGDITFTDQTAFVADFKQNAIIKCLNIDGIVGSNLMKHCNWTIDMQNETIHLSSHSSSTTPDAFVTIPFKRNAQYDIILDLKIGQTSVDGVKLDYGSNGSLSLPKNTFAKLKSTEDIHTLKSSGFTQSGLFGVRKPYSSELFRADSIRIEDLLLDNILIKSGKSSLLGGKILTNYIVHINWDNQTVAFAKQKQQDNFEATFGINIGFTDKLIVQSVLDNTPAKINGIEANMEILKIDDLDFTSQHTLCDYLVYFKTERPTLQLTYKTLEGDVKEVLLTKKSPF